VRLAVLVTILALAFPAGANAYPWENGEPPILLGSGVEQPCEYCLPVQGTVTGPADALAFQAANTPLAKAYGWWLNSPCTYAPQVEQKDNCAKPTYSGSFGFGIAPSWFWQEPHTFRVWALRESETCVVHYSAPYQTAGPGCTERQEVCSPPQLVTIPATVQIACRANATVAKRHHKHPRHRR
jgi:hypothetical protein